MDTCVYIKNDAKKFLQTVVKMNIAAFRGYNCTPYWPLKLITEFFDV